MRNRVASYQKLVIVLRLLLYDTQHGHALRKELGFAVGYILLELEERGLVRIKADRNDSRKNLYKINFKRKQQAIKIVRDGLEHFRSRSILKDSRVEIIKRFEDENATVYEWERAIQEIRKDPKKEKFFNYLKNGFDKNKVTHKLVEITNILPSGKGFYEYLYYFKQIGVTIKERQEKIVLDCEFSMFVCMWEQFACIEQILLDKYKFLSLNRMALLCTRNEVNFDSYVIRNDLGEEAFNWLSILDNIGLVNLRGNILKKPEICNFFYNFCDFALREVLNEK